MRRSSPVQPESGLRHLWRATLNSVAGFRCLLSEAAFRHELIGFGALLAVFIAVGAKGLDYLVAAILFLILVGVEALNTAVELIVDRSSPEISNFGRDTKDLGSFATFCLIAANGLFALWVVGRSLFG